MSSITNKKSQIYFKAVETPTAWVVLAFAWKIVDGSIVYSEPKVVRIIQKQETALAGKSAAKNSGFSLAGIVAAAKRCEAAIPSPYSFIFAEKRSGSIAWYGALPPPIFA